MCTHDKAGWAHALKQVPDTCPTLQLETVGDGEGTSTIALASPDDDVVSILEAEDNEHDGEEGLTRAGTPHATGAKFSTTQASCFWIRASGGFCFIFPFLALLVVERVTNILRQRWLASLTKFNAANLTCMGNHTGCELVIDELVDTNNSEEVLDYFL